MITHRFPRWLWRFGFLLLTSVGLWAGASPAAIPDDTVNISAAEFQRLAYAGRVLAGMAHKPELDAVLQTLLEVQRRNPDADPAELANVLEQGLERFRAHAPSYLRSTEARDELLAVYLEAFHQVPAHTNLNAAIFPLLDILMGEPGRKPPTNTLTAADLLHAGSQGFIHEEDSLVQRQSLVDACTRRAQRNTAFRRAMDALLLPELGVSLSHTAAQIINGDAALSNNPTMRALLTLSLASGHGGLQISTAQIDRLFTNQVEVLRGTIEANRATHRTILQAQSDFMAYLANTNLVELMAAYEAAQKEPQADLIVGSHASVHTLSALLETRDDKRSRYTRALGDAWVSLSQATVRWQMNSKFAAINQWNKALKFGKLSKGLTAGGGIAGAATALLVGFAFPSPEEIMLKEIGKVKEMIYELGTEMHARFDQVDRSLNTIQTTLDDTLKLVNVVEYEVQQVRQGLLNVQLDLHRLERQLFSSFTAERRGELNQAINGALYYGHFHPGSAMAWEAYSALAGPENHFYTYASDWANDDIYSASGFAPGDLTDANLYHRYRSFPLNANLNFTRQVLTSRFGFNATGLGALANPQDWFVSAYAYLQLAVENPMHFRNLGLRLGPVIGSGENLTRFLGRLTFSGTNVHWPLYDRLLTNYLERLVGFVSRVSAREQEYANLHLDRFAVEPWRHWAANAPRIATDSTTIRPVILDAVTSIAAGGWQSLALQRDGTIVAWGVDGSGQTGVPANLTNAVTIAAGERHGLALRADGIVVGWHWGDTSIGQYGQASVPWDLSNVVAIAAGAEHSLAARADGRVVGWGRNNYGQARTPDGLRNVIAVAAGYGQSLALRSDGTVVGWGNNNVGQANVPATATHAVAIAAGGNFSLALKSDGIVVPWGAIGVPAGLSGVKAIAAGFEHCLALKGDGTVVAWGNNPYGQVSTPAGLNGVVAIAAGKAHSLARKTDGTIVGWGANYNGQAVAPSGTPPDGAVAISAGLNHSLALKADGTVVGWGANNYDKANGALAGNNVLAISAGRHHSLALRADGTVVGWGSNAAGQRDLDSARNRGIVAIAAGYNHSLALKADGTVVGWGSNDHGQRDLAAAENHDLVAIVAGHGSDVHFSLALRKDGKVVSWGGGWIKLDASWNHDVVAIATHGNHLGLMADGRVFGWGDRTGAYWIPGLANVVAIDVGQGHALFLQANGTVLGIGLNGQGQATGVPSSSSISSPQVVRLQAQPLTGVVAISAGGYRTDRSYGHSLALRADGTVVAWGHSGDGQANVPSALTQYDGPMACFKSTGLTATNATSSALDARLMNGPAWTAGAPALGSAAGYALSFDGVDDHLVVPPGTWFSDDFTIEAWVFERSYNNWSRVIDFGNGSDANNVYLALSWGTTGKPLLDVYRDAVPQYVVAPQPIPLNQWVHLAATLRGSVATLYINGVGVATNAAVPPPKAVNRLSNYIGRSNWGADACANAIIDDVRIWKVARSRAEIAADMTHRPSGTEPNLVAYWSFDDGPGPGISALTSGAAKVAAGDDHSLALRSDGTVVAWGVNNLGQCEVPAGLHEVVDIAAGYRHSLALRSDGSVVGWGQNEHGQANGSAAGMNLMAVAAGCGHSLALTVDGRIVGWGRNHAGQRHMQDLSGVVAIAAGGAHSLALKADGSVSARGANTAGQTNVPTSLGFAVAVAAGESHSLALQLDGRVVAWGWNGYGQASVPTTAQSGVVAIAAHRNHSLALKADGTVVAWGENIEGQTTLPAGLANVVAMAAGGRHNVFVTAQPRANGGGSLEYVLADVPLRVAKRLLCETYTDLYAEIATRTGNLHEQTIALSGAKALLQAVLELGMPYTLQRDDVLHGFFYGTESLADLDLIQGLLSTETNRLSSAPDAQPIVLEEIVWTRYYNFAERLQQCLGGLQDNGQPEIPRIVGHTLRLLHLLRDAWTQPLNSPAPALELAREGNDLRLTLYGEPYLSYTLQQAERLNLGDWSRTTNLYNQVFVVPPLANPPRFYRAQLQWP